MNRKRRTRNKQNSPAVRLSQKHLEKIHTPEAIRARIGSNSQNYVKDAVLGAVDGCVTTFAVAAGAAGGALPSSIVVILGAANLLADGFSMAVSSYLSTRSGHERVELKRAEEREHIRRMPHAERDEVREIFIRKGFHGDVLQQAVAIVTADEDRWVETMIKDELGLQPHEPNALLASAVTFIAFLTAGAIPLIPFLAADLARSRAFAISAALTGAAFALVGALRARLVERSMLRGALETTFTGGGAAALPFVRIASVSIIAPHNRAAGRRMSMIFAERLFDSCTKAAK